MVDNNSNSSSGKSFMSSISWFNTMGAGVVVSKKSAGLISKYAHISKNEVIDGKTRPDVID